ncbi:UNVERIFIED_CONTAM: Retrovirus-related Pol polyprotein from transposon TNT 1-94 [Trichonephila clavipes]
MNGVNENLNYTALDTVRAVLRSSGLSNKFWSEALLCCTYTWNQICHQNQTKLPFELYCCRNPSVKHLKTFGYRAYVGIPKQLRYKLNMGDKRLYQIWIPEERKILEIFIH